MRRKYVTFTAPADGIPYWDFDAPDGDEYRDASAGAIMASAFVELRNYFYRRCKRRKKLFVYGREAASYTLLRQTIWQNRAPIVILY